MSSAWAVARARAAWRSAFSSTPSGVRTAVVVGDAILSLAAQIDRPIAATPARMALAVSAWRAHTASGPSPR